MWPLNSEESQHPLGTDRGSLKILLSNVLWKREMVKAIGFDSGQAGSQSVYIGVL